MFESAAGLVATTSCPIGDGFVHGDLWQGNTLWDDSRFIGTVDWTLRESDQKAST